MHLFKVGFVLLCAVLFSAQPLLANNTADSTIRLLVFGDSLAAGYGLQSKESFPYQLEVALRKAGYDVSVINAGVSGDTSAGGLSRVEWVLMDAPHIVIVELGANDALRGLSPSMTKENLEGILTKLQQRQVRVILAGMKAPRNLGDDYVNAFDKIYPQLSKRYNIPLVPFFLDGVALNPKLNLVDGIHPNADGVLVIVRNILPLVESVIAPLIK